MIRAATSRFDRQENMGALFGVNTLLEAYLRAVKCRYDRLTETPLSGLRNYAVQVKC